MKAICVTPSRTLELRDIAEPENPPPAHVLVDMDSATITHGDKFFLNVPLPNGTMAGSRMGVYGSNGTGTVLAVGEGVAEDLIGRQVAIYKTLSQTPETLGVWSKRVVVTERSCLVLPQGVAGREFNGSFANVLTVYAFMAQAADEGHRGVIVTAGNSATGRMAIALARHRNMPAIFLVRSPEARDALVSEGAAHVLVTGEEGFGARLETLAADLSATAVFDGVGGPLLGRVLMHLPMNSTVYIYGFLGASAPAEVPTTVIMAKNLQIRRFANPESPTVADPARLDAARAEISKIIDDPLLKTNIGRTFAPEQIEEAMAYEDKSGGRAVLVF